jgi:hypothetical protein
VGVGGFKEAYAERVPWFIVAGLILAFRHGDTSSTAGTARLIAGLGFAAIVVHSLFYNAFFEDPLTWALLAIAAVAATAREPEPAAEPET